MKIYEVIFDEEIVICIKRTNEDGTESFIPTDERNKDYKEYLDWLAQQESN